MNNVTREIKVSTGLSIKEFCEKELNTQYPAFNERLKQNRLYPAEIFYISWRTKKGVKELFGTDWESILTTAQVGGVVDQVRDIIAKMSPEEKMQMSSLLGFNPHAPAESPPAPQPEKTQAPKPDKNDPLSEFFIKTY